MRVYVINFDDKTEFLDKKILGYVRLISDSGNYEKANDVSL